MKRQQLQSELKSFRNQGIKVNCKLNATNVILQAEYDRIMATKVETKVEAPVQHNDAGLVQQLQEQLAAALAKVAEQQQTIDIQETTIATMQETIDTMGRIIQDFKGETIVDEAVQDAVEVQATVVVDEAAVVAAIVKHNNYASFDVLGQELGLEPKQLHEVLYSLEAADVIETSAVAEPRDYSVALVETWGISQLAGGPLFFATVNEVEAEANQPKN